MRQKITWLHLSDLHLCPNRTGWDATRVLRLLRRDLRSMAAELGTPDLVLFTGDVAFGHLGDHPGESLREQYLAARTFFDGILTTFDPPVPKDRLFIVPGNHDVNRNAVGADQITWLDQLTSEEPVLQLIQRGTDPPWRRFMERLAEYRAFLESYGCDHLLDDKDRLTFATTRDCAGVPLVIVGFNSAWASGRDSEQGHLWIGGAYQARLREAYDDRHLAIALIHHPRDWIVEYEKNRFWRSIIQSRFRFCLHGHEHDAWVDSTAAHTTIAAGACYQRSDKENGYNWVELDLASGRGAVWLRRYEDRGSGGWIPCVIPGMTDDRGRWPLVLPWLRSLSRSAVRSSSVRNDRGGPTTSSSERSDVDRLRTVARWHTDNDISATVGRKYDPLLYVHRDIEQRLTEHLAGDRHLLDVISTSRERLQRHLGRALAHLQQQSLSGKDARRADRIRSQYEEVLETLDVLLDGGNPCDDHLRPAFQQLGSLSHDMQKQIDEVSDDHLGPEDSRSCEEFLRDIGRWTTVRFSNTAIIIDRAGGGKTNLMCNLALAESTAAVQLFLNGRTPIEDDSSLLTSVMKRLGFAKNGGAPLETRAKELLGLLEREHLCLVLLIDGINEARDIAAMNRALTVLISVLDHSRVRFLVTCRDIYWRFFESEEWAAGIGLVLKAQLYEFTRWEQDEAVERYLDHYNIDVELGPVARERCRHPLLLRFLCEAYGSPDGERVKLKRIEDIRLKPLFDDYWANKIRHARGDTAASVASSEKCLSRMVDHMFASRAAAITTEEFREVTEVDDMETEESPYLRLLDEDIIIEELPTDQVETRRIVFVYEEFMEYVMARQLFYVHIAPGTASIDEVFGWLSSSVDDLVNTLGVGEYVCAFCFDEGQLKAALRLLVLMANDRHNWREIVRNVFQKYDQAIDMLLEAEGGIRERAKDMEAILEVLSAESKEAVSETCIALGFRLAFPALISLADVREGRIPPVLEPQTFDEKALVSAVRAVASMILKANLNPSRKGYWREMTKVKTILDPRAFVRALWNLIGASSRRELLLGLACNGLFSPDCQLRRAAALITRDGESAFVQEIRKRRLAVETDEEAVVLLKLPR